MIAAVIMVVMTKRPDADRNLITVMDHLFSASLLGVMAPILKTN
ncbi:hypothetical protein [Brucella intermedia]|nr:hypothetical protein [Brucella intermedia]